MNLTLSDEAIEFGQHARSAFERAGGDALAQEPEGAPGLIESVLAALGAGDLDPRASTADLEAAAALCRSAGWWALPYPVAGRLAGRRGLDGDDALGLVLASWTLLGMTDRALELTRAHVRQRHQFGQPIASFQGAQFQLTDAEVERCGLEVLALHALWSVRDGGPDALVDALALRMAALEAAEVVFRVAHQLHGAHGFCDDATVSWLSRHSQPLRRSPLGLSATRQHVADLAGRHGFRSLFGRG